MTRDRRRRDKTLNVDCDETICQPLIGQKIPVLNSDWLLMDSLKSLEHI